VRELFGSRPDVPADAVSGAIRAGAALSPPSASAYLGLAMWPRSGWYPVLDLATKTGLLLLLGWTFVFGAHELTASVRRTQGALAQVRKRLHAVNERLFNEMEQHQALQKSLEHARYHDSFTGLPNRRYLMDQLDRALREVRTRRRQRIAVASRIGLTCIDSGLQRVEEALREADIALSFAKRQPAQPIVAYTPGMGGAAVSLVSLEADLHVALDRRQFRLLFQP